jgi:predicted transcriptional regulator of viral defense system
MNDDKQKVRQLLAELAKDRVVTAHQLAEMLGEDQRHASNVVRSLRSKGLLLNVQRGVYASVPLEVSPGNFRPDPVLVVHAVLGQEYAFSHFTALLLHGAEHNAHRTVHVTKPGVRSRRLMVGNVPVHVHGVSDKNWDLAVTTVKRGRASLAVTTPERTMLDLVGLPPKKQDYEEVVHAFLGLKQKMSMPDLVAESMLWGNNTTLARMGHLLSHHASAENGDPFGGKMGEFVALRSPYYFGTQPRNPANKLDSTFNVVYPGA